MFDYRTHTLLYVRYAFTFRYLRLLLYRRILRPRCCTLILLFTVRWLVRLITCVRCAFTLVTLVPLPHHTVTFLRLLRLHTPHAHHVSRFDYLTPHYRPTHHIYPTPHTHHTHAHTTHTACLIYTGSFLLPPFILRLPLLLFAFLPLPFYVYVYVPWFTLPTIFTWLVPLQLPALFTFLHCARSVHHARTQLHTRYAVRFVHLLRSRSFSSTFTRFSFYHRYRLLFGYAVIRWFTRSSFSPFGSFFTLRCVWFFLRFSAPVRLVAHAHRFVDFGSVFCRTTFWLRLI